MNELRHPRPAEQPVLERETYCARLGHFVPFRYCLHPASDDPCFRILDCWWQIFDVVAYLQTVLPEPVFHKILEAGPLPNRIEGILKVLSDFRKRGGEGAGD